ncbi:RbsD/FucU domain-containing protein [Mycolicibacterium cosmeticum]|uniref:RbsD/FucU domain-containing protein n=1 Tax=Mycolicibacterium cosmeticum TaxID=258533 RepID=UPI003204869D
MPVRVRASSTPGWLRTGGLGLAPEPIEHELFKAQVREVAFAVRTGEDTFYANVLCRAGVAFG